MKLKTPLQKKGIKPSVRARVGVNVDASLLHWMVNGSISTMQIDRVAVEANFVVITFRGTYWQVVNSFGRTF
jgi:hypothetical protein